MWTKEQSKELVLSYYNSWQEPADYEAMRACFNDDAQFNAGVFAVHSADEFVAMIQATESPWKNVQLLGSIFTEDSASLLYTGTDKQTGISYRVGEHIDIENGKIINVEAAISALNPSA